MLRMSNRFTNLHGLLWWLAVAALAVGCNHEVPLPDSVWNGADIVLEDDARVIEDVVPRRATLAGLLDNHAFDGTFVYQFVQAVRPVFDPRRIRVGNSYKLVVDRDGVLRRFEYHIDNDEFLRVDYVTDAEASFEALRVPYVKERTEVATRGLIDERNSSLSAALDDIGENVNLAILMAEVFSGEIDFNNDLRRGDRFDVLFEKYYREDVFSDYGDIVAAEFYNDGRTIQAFSYVIPGDDQALYYDADGRSLKRLFLRSPFRFEPRVTSRFSYRRLHPVLGTNRPHLGVDYGAPTGTPVIAVANGRVVSAAASGGSGNMVRLRHTNGYETYYLHLSRFATGMRPGNRVVQGQTIGYVGSTGLATGPHLDYRIRKNGTFVNPLIEHRNLPPGDPIPEEHLPAFIEARDQGARADVLTALPVTRRGARAVVALVRPFHALRPVPEAAAAVAAVPYDVVSMSEAFDLADGNPLSFLHVSRAEIDLDPATDPYDEAVYHTAADHLETLRTDAPLVVEDTPSLYFYRLRDGSHEQTGLAGCYSVDEYDRGVIKQHERREPTRRMTELATCWLLGLRPGSCF